MISENERAALVEELAEALAPYTNHKVACILRIEPIIDRLLAAHDHHRQVSVEYACGGQEYWDLEPNGTLRIDIPRDRVVVVSDQLAAHDLDAVRLSDMFYEAITVAHGEGEAFGRGRARIEGPTEHDATSFGDMAIGGIVLHRDTPAPGLVGFTISDRRNLAKEFADRAVAQAHHGSTGEGVA